MAAWSRRRLIPVLAVGVAAVAVGLGGLAWWLDHQRYEQTDNAFVETDKVVIAPQIDGYVSEVLVVDNQAVRPGQVLVRIDPATIQARLAEAEANAAALEAGVRQVDDKARLEQALIAQRDAGLASARAQAKFAHAESERYVALAGKGWVPPQRAQSVRAADEEAAAGVAQAEAALEAERRTSQSLGSARTQMQAQAQAAHAAVQQALIDLSRTEIRAPVAGVVGARSVRLGQYVRPGGALLTVVPVADAYVVANFKETQVARLRIGQPVEIRADAFGDKAIRGKVLSFAPATGSEFALIPVENAVGNFTRITQRLPVKIAIDRSQPYAGALRPGLSVKVKVDVRENTGVGFADTVSGPLEVARQGRLR